MFSEVDHPFVVAVHAVYALSGFGEYKFINTALANLAFETMSMIRVVSGHDGLVQNRQMAHIAAIRTVGTDWRPVR